MTTTNASLPRTQTAHAAGARRRATVRRAGLAALAACFAIATSPGFAQTCRDARYERSRIDETMQAIFVENPGSTFVFGLCRAVGEDNYRNTGDTGDAAAAFAVCSASFCSMTDSYQNCIKVNGELFVLVLRRVELEEGLARDC